MSRNLSRSFVVLGAMALLFAASGAAMGEVLFSDNFNGAGTPAATDWGLNANLTGPTGRLGGYLLNIDTALKTKAWDLARYSTVGAVRVNETTGAWNGADAMVGQYTGALPHHGVVIQHNFNDNFIAAAGSFSVRFDYTPVYSADTTSSTAVGGSVFIGGKDATCSTIALATQSPGRFDPNADLCIAFLGDGRVRATFAGDGNGYGIPTTLPDRQWLNFDTAPGTITAPKTYSLELTVTLLENSFAQGKSASANLKWLNNSGVWADIDINDISAASKVDGTDVTWAWDADGTNYMGFSTQLQSGKTQYSKWDNVSVNGTVPEPSTLALLACGLVGLLAYAWRKRK